MNLLIIFCPPGRAIAAVLPETRAKRAPIPGTGSNRHDFPTGRAGRSLFAKAVLLGGPRVRISFPPAASLSHWCLPRLQAQKDRLSPRMLALTRPENGTCWPPTGSPSPFFSDGH